MIRKFSCTYFKVPYRLQGSVETQIATFKDFAEAIRFRSIDSSLHAGLVQMAEARTDKIRQAFDKECDATNKLIRKIKREQKKKQKEQQEK